MTQETQVNDQPQVPDVQIGFGRALTIMYGENWREVATETQINTARHFYNAGLNDVQFLIQINNAQLSQNLQSVASTMVVGAERQLADQTAEAEVAKSVKHRVGKSVIKQPVAKPIKRGKK